jgi:deoxyribodipyrimidine photo-lyase
LRALAQRDFFLQLGWYNESLAEEPLQAKMRSFAFARSHPQLDAWRAGRTGFPLVDAGMRELIATGWMHPRVRAIAASFLCFDLGVDWRVGRDAWDRLLIEDDPVLAAGNWQWVAGVGADLAAYPRIYNPLKQARRFDPSAEYIRTWVPELAGLPDVAILDPVEVRRERQLTLELFGDGSYPAPVLDHEAAARGSWRATRARFVLPPDLRASSLLLPLASERLDLEPLRVGHAEALYAGLREPSLYAVRDRTAAGGPRGTANALCPARRGFGR